MRSGLSTWRHAITVGILTLLLATSNAATLQPVSVRSSLLPATAGGNGDSLSPIISADGRYVLFASSADNLTATILDNPASALAPARLNVFLHDRTNVTTTLVSVHLGGGGGGNGDSLPSAISSNGRYALFESTASDLVANDTNASSDVFVRDVVSGTTTLVNVATNGIPGNGASRSSVMTPDGRYVAFVSAATNLVAGDTNKIPDVFVRDVLGNTTTLVSVGAVSTNASQSAGSSESPGITPDGRYVVFSSTATNLVPGLRLTGEVFVRDLVGGTTTWVSTNARAIHQSVIGSTNVVSYNQKISNDGQFVAFVTSTNPTSGSVSRGVVLRHNLQTGTTDIVNSNAYVPWGASEDIRTLDTNPDGRFIAFVANGAGGGAGALTNTAIYLWDALMGTNILVSADLAGMLPTNGICDSPSVDPSGRFVAFLSSMTNLTTNVLAGEFHLYLRDVQTGATRLLDADTNGIGTGVNPTAVACLSVDGKSVAFECSDGHLVANDRNRDYDVFVRNLANETTELISVHDAALPTQTPNGPSTLYSSCVSSNGRYVVFASDASDLVPNDTNGYRDVFVRNMVTGTNILVSADTNGFPGAGQSFEPAISGDGRYVTFTSWANNLVGGDTNKAQDVFVRDLLSNTTALVSLNKNGVSPGNNDSFSPLISTDGRYVLFHSKAENLTSGSFGTAIENLFLRDMQAGTNYAVSTSFIGGSSGVSSAAMTPDGNFVAFVGQLGNSGTRIHVWQLQTRTWTYTNAATSPNSVSISPDGQRLAYTAGTVSSSLSAVDLSANTNWQISAGSFPSRVGMRFSLDGRFLTYATIAANSFQDLNTASDVYIYDFQTGANFLASRSFDSTNAPNGASDSPDISADGRFISFRSYASNNVPGDFNGVPDLFVFDRMSGATTLESASQTGYSPGNHRSLNPAFSDDGKTIVMQSWASDLVSQDFNNSADIFVLNFIPASPPNPTNEAATLVPVIYFGVVPGSGVSTAGPVLFWPAVPGIAYRVQFKNDLNDLIWQDLNGSVTLIGPNGYAVDFTPAMSQRYYRFLLSN